MSIPMKDPRLAAAANRADERLMLVADMPDDVDEDQILGEQAVLAFAGTDLDGYDALRVIKLLAEDAVRAIAEATARGEDNAVASELRGTLLATFLFGYFAREEVERAS